MCDACGKSFDRPQALGAHRAYVHSGRRPKPRAPRVVDGTPIPDAEPITVAFSQREWAAIVRLSRRENCTPTAVVRAAVQQVLRGAA